MKARKLQRFLLTLFQGLLIPPLIYYSFYTEVDILVATQGYLETMRRAWLIMMGGLLRPRNIIVSLTILLLIVLWLKSSGRRRWLYYGLIVFFSVTYSTADVLFYSSFSYISHTRQIVPWVLWTLVMAFLFWREFRRKGREEPQEQPADPAATSMKRT